MRPTAYMKVIAELRHDAGRGADPVLLKHKPERGGGRPVKTLAGAAPRAAARLRATNSRLRRRPQRVGNARRYRPPTRVAAGAALSVVAAMASTTTW
jgi:hypothetical protein